MGRRFELLVFDWDGTLMDSTAVSVAAAYGAHPREQLAAWRPLACLDQPRELWNWLKQNA
jgi:beta-phosphoglucomutase-like phosphatase (HAD superfamily)